MKSPEEDRSCTGSLREIKKSADDLSSNTDFKIGSAEDLSRNSMAPSLGPISLLDLPTQYPTQISGRPLQPFGGSEITVLSEPSESEYDFSQPWYTVSEGNQSLGARRFE